MAQGQTKVEPPAGPGGLPRFDPWAEVRTIARNVWQDITAHPLRHLTLAAASAAVGFLINFAIMAVRHDGFRTPRDAVVVGQGSFLGGAVFWLLLPALVAMLIGLVRRDGRAAMQRRLREAPDTFRSMIELDGRLATSHLLFGFGGAAMISSLVQPAAALATGVWIVVLLLLPWRRLLVGLAGIVWEWLLQTLRIERVGARNVSIMVAMLGASGALITTIVIPGPSARMLVGIAAWGAGLVIARRELAPEPSPAVGSAAAVVLGVLAGAGLLVLLDVHPAFADDGGWRECGQPGMFRYVFSCTGSVRVTGQSLLGGTLAFVGSLIGSSTATEGPTDGPSPLYGSGCNPPRGGGYSGDGYEIGDHQRAAEQHPDVKKYRSWRQAHPDGTIEEYWDYHEKVQDLHEAQARENEPWLSRKLAEFDDYMGEVGTELNKDWETGEMTDRLTRMPKHVVPALVDYLKDLAQTASQNPTTMAMDMAWQKSKELIGYVEAVGHARSLPPEQREQAYADILGEIKSNDPGHQMIQHLDQQWEKLEKASLSGDNETLADIFTTAGVYLMADSALGHKMAGGTTASATQGSFQLKSKEYFSRPAMGAASAGAQPRTKADIIAQARAEGRPVRVRADEFEQFGVESEVGGAIHQATIEGELRYVGFKDGDIHQVRAREDTPFFKNEDNKFKSYQPEVDAPLQGKTPEEMEWARNRIASFEPTVKPGPDAPKELHDRWKLRTDERVEYADQLEAIREKGAMYIDENGNTVRVRQVPDEHGIFVSKEGMHGAGDLDTAYYMDGKQKLYEPRPLPDDLKDFIDSLPPADRTALMDAAMDAAESETIVGYLRRVSKGKIQHEGNTWRWDPKSERLIKKKRETLDVIESEGTFHIDKDGGTYCPNPATNMGRNAGELPETLAGAGAAGAGRETSKATNDTTAPGYDTQAGGPSPSDGAEGYDTQPGGSSSPGGAEGYDTQPGGSSSSGGASGYDTQPGGGSSPGGPSGYDAGPTTGGGQ